MEHDGPTRSGRVQHVCGGAPGFGPFAGKPLAGYRPRRREFRIPSESSRHAQPVESGPRGPRLQRRQPYRTGHGAAGSAESEPRAFGPLRPLPAAGLFAEPRQREHPGVGQQHGRRLADLQHGAADPSPDDDGQQHAVLQRPVGDDHAAARPATGDHRLAHDRDASRSFHGHPAVGRDQ